MNEDDKKKQTEQQTHTSHGTVRLETLFFV